MNLLNNFIYFLSKSQTGSDIPSNIPKSGMPELTLLSFILIGMLGLIIVLTTLFSKLNKSAKIIISLIAIVLTGVTIYVTYSVIQQLLNS